ncbi:uncharacterized protein LOC104434219 [Eucalyptus grandis]|uniref:uncharacterized protein LOC104434219 n=1 Tax=Eucalyptus grandis TaxID=71139 RepID=UPI00192F0AA7|nr:uncharacterized protein LOC104434219 [Eucalyptus grandis]
MECNKNFNARDNDSAADANCAPAPSRPIKPSFWTQCSACHVKFEYLLCYSNKLLRCRNSNCRKPFVAIEIAPPPMEGNGSSPSKAFFEAQPFPNRMRNNVYALVGRQTSPTNAGSTSFSGIHLPEKLASSDGTSIKFVSDKGALAPASYSPPSGVLEPIVWHRKRDREEAATTVKERCSGMIQRLKAGSGSVGMSSNVNSLENEGIKKSQVGEGGMNKKVTEDASLAAFANGRGLGSGSTSGSRKRRLEDKRRVNFGVINQFNSLRNLSRIETQKMLICKAKKEIFQKINEWSNGKVTEGYGEEQKAPPNGAKTIAVKHKKPIDGKDKVHLKKPSPAISNVETEAENFVFKQMLIAPDFHDFDNDRTEVSFANNQVWAVYDDDDGMPRYYALIHNVITLKPFKVCISWLGSNSNQELGPIPWVKSGFAKTCGDLQVRKSVVYGTLNAFSHTMRWTKGTGGLIQIYPLKGDVWALYSNWTNNWNESTPNEVKHSYDLVEVIEDNNEDRGITVAPLTKVCGMKTVFRKNSDPCKLWTVPREEMFRFSHQVPAHLLTGEEGADAHIGCWELDPASTGSC